MLESRSYCRPCLASPRIDSDGGIRLAAAMTTPAAQTLTQAGIAFETVRFDPTLDANAAAAAIGLPLGAICKTLACVSMPRVVLVVLPTPARLDLDKLKTLTGEPRTAMIAAAAMGRMTGMQPGAVTPVPAPGGRRFQVYVDQSVMAFETIGIGIGGGAAGVELLLGPKDLLAATDGQVADLTANT